MIARVTTFAIDDGWRFTKGDPPGNTVSLLYDVRPEVREQRDDLPADAQPRGPEGRTGSAATVIKPWILPTGNAFIKAKVRYLDLATGRSFGEEAIDTSSSAWQGIFAPMTDKQLAAIAKEVVGKVKH